MKTPVTTEPKVQSEERLLGLEPISAIESLPLPARPRTLLTGVRLNLRGRSVRLRGLRQPPTGMLRWLLILGPGLIGAAAGNDAGGIATFSQVGARYGYDLIWLMLLMAVSLGVVQEMCARLGAATGRGLLDLIRERFGLGWAFLAVSVILIANAGLVVSEFVGIGAALEMLGVSKYRAVPVAALLIWSMVLFGSYRHVERVLLFVTLVFLTYPLAAIVARPQWLEVARGAFVPTFHRDSYYLMMLVGLIGTTITPYIQLFQQSSIVERGTARRHYGPERFDAYVGSAFACLMSIFIIIAAAATLRPAGKTEIETAADAASALAPVAGAAAEVMFAVGLLGASLLAAVVLPLATSFAVSEAFGFAKGVNLDFRRAQIFFGLFTALILLGVLLALVPGLPVIELLLGVQVLNGLILPVMLVFILRLANDERLTGELKNTRAHNLLGWGTLALVVAAVAIMAGTSLLGLLGTDLFA